MKLIIAVALLTFVVAGLYSLEKPRTDNSAKANQRLISNEESCRAHLFPAKEQWEPSRAEWLSAHKIKISEAEHGLTDEDFRSCMEIK